MIWNLVDSSHKIPNQIPAHFSLSPTLKIYDQKLEIWIKIVHYVCVCSHQWLEAMFETMTKRYKCDDWLARFLTINSLIDKAISKVQVHFANIGASHGKSTVIYSKQSREVKTYKAIFKQSFFSPKVPPKSYIYTKLLLTWQNRKYGKQLLTQNSEWWAMPTVQARACSVRKSHRSSWAPADCEGSWGSMLPAGPRAKFLCSRWGRNRGPSLVLWLSAAHFVAMFPAGNIATKCATNSKRV